jgi:hypothetical protein
MNKEINNTQQGIRTSIHYGTGSVFTTPDTIIILDMAHSNMQLVNDFRLSVFPLDCQLVRLSLAECWRPFCQKAFESGSTTLPHHPSFGINKINEHCAPSNYITAFDSKNTYLVNTIKLCISFSRVPGWLINRLCSGCALH